MAERPCLVEECTRPAGVPGSARGYCAGHYKRAKKYGDPRTTGVVRNVCAVDGCDLFCEARGWCSKHFTRWRRFGDPLHRLRGEVRDGCRICPGCGLDKPVSEWGASASTKTGLQGRCRPCAAATTTAWRRANPEHGIRPKECAPCSMCGAVFAADRRRSATCSLACARAMKRLDDLTRPRDRQKASEANRQWRLRYPERNWAKAAARRALVSAAVVEKVDRAIVFERDGWTCSICAEPIDRAAAWPHPLSPSVDHRRPLIKGGNHSYANCRATHLVCNLRKGARELTEVG